MKEVKAMIWSVPKSPTQSGKKKHGCFVLKLEDGSYRKRENLMGWIASDAKKVEIEFPSLERAIKYAKSNGLAYEVVPQAIASIVTPKSYADNFTRKIER